MFDGPARYNYQDLPKFLIYVLQMYMNQWGDKPMVPYVVFGKQQKAPEGTENSENRKSKITYKKLKRPSWRETKNQLLMKNGNKNSMQMDFYIDISQNTERNFVEDVLVPLLRLISSDQSIRIEDLPCLQNS